MEFIENYPVDKLIAAEYNPREINEVNFKKLLESIKKFGIIKPIILNGENGIITAGHQRVKAVKILGIKTIPVIKLSDIKKSDEIIFNLFHNSIETNRSKVWIEDLDNLKFGYNFINPEKIYFEKNLNPVVVKEIGNLIIKYGAWGSGICDETGNILLNSEYTLCCKLLNVPLLIFKVENTSTKELINYFSIDYGEYYFDALNIKDYNQTYCQMNRLKGKKSLKSTTYEKFVIPILDKNLRILDFGAGKCAYPLKLRQLGYKFFMYEPFFRKNGENAFQIGTVVKFIKELEKDICKNGLFDMVVLDSVLNSVTSDEMTHNILLSCNALLKEDGCLTLGTRSLQKVEQLQYQNQSTGIKREIEFLDKKKFGVTFRSGVWTKQKFHTKESLQKTLNPYFKEIVIQGQESRSNIYAVCKNPRRWSICDYEKALNIEFNMTYPKGFKHNQHEKLVAEILTRLN